MSLVIVTFLPWNSKSWFPGISFNVLYQKQEEKESWLFSEATRKGEKVLSQFSENQSQLSLSSDIEEMLEYHLIGSSSWCQSRSCWWWCNADFLFLLLTNDQGSTDAWSPSRHHGPSLRVRQHKHGEIFCRSSLLPKITKNVINHWTRDSIFDFNHPNQSS